MDSTMSSKGNKDNSPNKPQAKIPPLFITGYPTHVQRSELRKFLSSYGKIGSCTIYNDYTTVQFYTDNGYKSLLHKPIHFHDNLLKVRIANRTDLKRKDSHDEDEHNTASQNEIVESSVLRNKLLECSSVDEQITCILNEIALPYQEIIEKYTLLYKHLDSVLGSAFTGCKAIPFGSTVTGLAFKGSDLDIFVSVPQHSRQTSPNIPLPVYYVNASRKFLYRRPDLFKNVISIAKAKTPILKCIHKVTGISCDINFKNMLGVCNSTLVNFLLNKDPRLRPMMIIIKYWARINDITSPGKMTNYALVMLVIFYLQQKKILPSVSCLQNPQFDNIIEGWNGGFNQNFYYPILNTDSIPQLLYGFFEFYYKFEFGIYVISPFAGLSLPKSSFIDQKKLENIFWRYKNMTANDNSMPNLDVDKFICVQDPFEHNHNLTKNVTSATLKNFQLFCSVASKLCQDTINTNSPTMLLQKLFVANTQVEKPGEITILPNSFLMNKTVEEMNKTEEILCKEWFERVNEILLIILIRIFKLELSVNKTEQPQAKAAKTENVLDVHDDFIETFNIHCIGYYPIFNGRKKIYREMKGVDGFEREIRVSDILIDKYYKNVFDKKPILELDIVFSARRRPTRIVLLFKNSNTKLKNFFSTFLVFLERWLPLWINKFIYEKQVTSEKHMETNSVEEMASTSEIVQE